MRILFGSWEAFDAACKPDLPDPDSPIPWVVEAPLCAVEIYEAILHQQAIRTEPLTVWTSPAGFVQRRAFRKGQMTAPDCHAFRDYVERDVPYVLLSKAETTTLEKWLLHRDIHIWSLSNLFTPFGKPRFVQNWAAAMDHEQAVEACRELLQELGLPPAQPLARSLLPMGVKPIATEEQLKGSSTFLRLSDDD
ncbi:hypothetical protein HRG_010672 [Hirsutella rhossiliensis]|uniref:Uncharacterized protein n=1 Tax=Hirsutella rhossiliensis TaxID=111463 RepID=A0A9P8SET9_9HYPO|nr:uncharacterized protein HRG_10672 [Hirsutella rhossiliensis]KAH0958371.1 hypothetical protein HRG_10672 [Hirsutella rhossiliensis]